MNNPIANALHYLNELDIRGERNCVLLAAAIRELKPLASLTESTQVTPHEDHQP